MSNNQDSLDSSIDSSRNAPLNSNVNGNQNAVSQFNFNREISKLLEPSFKYFKYGLLLEVLGTISVFYLAFCDIHSNYNMSDSIILVVLGFVILLLCYYMYRLFSNQDAYVNRKKCYLIYFMCIGFSIAAASASYLASAKQAEWCGYVITFNGPLTEHQINSRLQEIGICNHASYSSIKSQVKSVILDKCGNSSYCQTRDYFLTPYKLILGTSVVNIIIYLGIQLVISVYMYQRVNSCHSIVIQKQQSNHSQQNNNPQNFNRFQNNHIVYNARNQNNPPQIYQAQLAPTFFDDSHPQFGGVVIGQPIPIHENIVYYNANNPVNKARGYSVTKVENNNL